MGLRSVPAFYVERQPLGWIDALFTATSAVCVTGLIVVDTATHFTRLGQAFILLLIQVGGLGMITITSLITLSLGRRLSLRTESVVPLMPSSLPDVAPRRLIRDIVLSKPRRSSTERAATEAAPTSEPPSSSFSLRRPHLNPR